MSNAAVGNVYQAIIDEVINSSRVDFEENGVEESVLEELRASWQQKLSQLDVARFPWDPKPVDPPPPGPGAGGSLAPAAAAQPQSIGANPSPVPVHSQPQFAPQLNLPTGNGAEHGIKQEHGAQAYQQPLQQTSNGGPAIKQEPGTQPDPNAFLPQHYGNDAAAMRAAQNMAARFGNQAQNSINALQSGGGGHQGEAAQKPPPPAHPTPARTQEEYRQQMAASTAAQQQQHAHLSNGQTDGAGEEEDEEDFEGVLMRRNEAGELQEMGRIEIDNLLHRQIAARAKAMEGGGLMVPLKEATGPRKTTASFNVVDPSASREEKERKIAAHDGGDEEDDEDAINSDLDDPEDDEGDPEADDEGLGHIMLCMYDKVQRVKNKWKCTLKDGVLTVNGKEYVFHKATGEYEW